MTPPTPADRLRREVRSLLRKMLPRRDLVVVRLQGEIDAATADRASRALRAALQTAPKTIEIDLSRVTRMSSEGTQPLFLAARDARARGIRLTVTHAQDQVHTVMRRVGLERYLSDEASGG